MEKELVEFEEIYEEKEKEKEKEIERLGNEMEGIKNRQQAKVKLIDDVLF